MPWEMLASRLDRFLNLGRLCLTIAGAAIVVEIACLFRSDPPGVNRGWLHDEYFLAYHQKPSPLVPLLLFAVALLASYTIGLISTVVPQLVYGKFISLVRVLRQRAEREAGISADDESVGRAGPRDGGFIRFLRQATYVLGVGRTTPEDLWRQLTDAYGTDRVAAALARHPLRLRVGSGNDAILSTEEYCSSWLRRYSPDQAKSSYTMITGSYSIAFLVPMILLPFALSDVAGDTGWYSRYGALSGVLTFAFMLWVAAKSTTLGRASSYAVFRQWLTMELVLTHSPSDVPEPAPAVANAAEAGTEAFAVPASRAPADRASILDHER